ncbi:MAG: YfcE family phosphodiesterase [Gammaproteobacteria bacterium]|nr:YfcE family phosphodiesterase [Gammaproteobacteria bacterium]
MTTRIGIISDTHSSIKPLEDAIKLFETLNVDKIICAGDVAGYGEDELIQTVRLLQDKKCLIIAGNHDDLTNMNGSSNDYDELQAFFKSLPKFIELEIEGKSLYVVHAQPPDQQHGGIKLLDQDGLLINDQLEMWQQKLADFNHDILIVGHTHQVFSEIISDTLVINPGSSVFNHSCMVLSLPDLEVTVYPLQNKKINLSWNWGLLHRESKGPVNIK